MSHTPGPWTYIGHDDVITGIDGPVASLYCCYNYANNGPLIAAAPDLLTALLELVDVNKDFSEGLIHARAAIAKAKGIA